VIRIGYNLYCREYAANYLLVWLKYKCLSGYMPITGGLMAQPEVGVALAYQKWTGI